MAESHPHPASAHHRHAHDTSEDQGLFDLLDLDADVLHEYWSDALGWVRDMAASNAPTRVLDLGAGTGSGALGLAALFPDADVVAVDVSPESLARLRDKAHERRLTRVRTVEADLDSDWPDVGAVDLSWASMSLHHLADSAQTLRAALSATTPGGLIAVAEFAEPLRFLREDLRIVQPGFEQRLVDVLSAAHAKDLPTLGSDWVSRLTDAGWTVVTERDFVIDLDPPRHMCAVRYARAWFERLSSGMDDALDREDRATLAELLTVRGERSILRREALHIRGIRSVTVARRPDSSGIQDPNRACVDRTNVVW